MQEHYEGANRPQQGEGTKDNRHAAAVGSKATSEVTAPTEGRQKMTTGAGNMTVDIRETHGNR